MTYTQGVASGWAAVWSLVRYLQRGSLRPFVLYRLALGLTILAVLGAA